MQTTSPLHKFVESAKSKGASDEFLSSLLTRHGWSAEEVYSALGAYWERVCGIPIPARRSSGESSRDAFLYLLSFATLAIWSSALGSILFQFINLWLPDPVSGTARRVPDSRLAITWQMSSIAVAFPIYLLVFRLIVAESVNQPDQLQSGVRKWLTWLALLITAGTLMGDLICFLNYYLTGEITTRFVLKSLVVFIICGGIFIWYLGSLRWTRDTQPRTIRARAVAFALVATFTVVAVFCTGLSVAGTPGVQRRFGADLGRIRDLNRIAQQLHYSKAQAGSGILKQYRDPETGRPYDYHEISSTEYELCAKFNEASPKGATGFWLHGAGQTCFRFDAAKPVPWQ